MNLRIALILGWLPHVLSLSIESKSKTKQYQPRPQVLAQNIASSKHIAAIADRSQEQNGKTLSSISLNLKSLQQKLLDGQTKSRKAINTKKLQYERSLSEQAKENNEMLKINKAVKREIHRLRNEADLHRVEAQSILQQTKDLQSHLDALRFNISTAVRFSEVALQRANATLEDKKSMQFLMNVEKKEKSIAFESELMTRLDDISSGKAMSLLEVSSEHHQSLRERVQLHSEQKHGSEHKHAQDPVAVLKVLAEAFANLQHEQNASMFALTKSYKDLWEKGTQQHVKIMEEQQKLNATREGDAKHNERIIDAVTYLTKQKTQQVNQAQSLQGFMLKLGKLVTPQEDVIQRRLVDRQKKLQEQVDKANHRKAVAKPPDTNEDEIASIAQAATDDQRTELEESRRSMFHKLFR